ncbi:MAG: hypothetical protein HRT80_09865 [Henriciella sp.]|nr:hypothetical protein [Henriciella sp.]
MGDTSSLPEFGENGSVLNSDTMTDELRQKYDEGENGFGWRGRSTPKVWPLSAIWMICFGYALAGYAIGKAPSLNSIWWFLGLALLAQMIVWLGQIWRRHWEKRQKKRA